MNTSTIIAAAITLASIALNLDWILYWIGPAGCIILIPALIVVLALPLIDESSWLNKVRPNLTETFINDIPEIITTPRSHAESNTYAALPADYHGVPSPQLALNERQLSGLRQLGQWIKTFLGAGSLSPGRQQNFDVLEKAEKIKITERIKPDGVRERSVMIFYRKA